jgi:hypothetical protein
MNKIFLLPLLLLSVGIFFVRMGTSGTTWAAQRETLSQAIQMVLENLRRESQLADEQRETAIRGAARQQAAEDVVAGRITLLEAAARFGELNSQLPNGGRKILLYSTGASEGERLCWQVIRWIRHNQLNLSEAEARTVERRLETELEDLLERDGTVQLPERISPHR